MVSILDNFKAVYDKLNPTIWYSVSEFTPPGKALCIAATAFFPETHVFHPDDWAKIHRELSDMGYQLRDVRFWRPEGTPAPRVIEGDARNV